MAYQPNIPTGTVPQNQDYLNIQGNFSELNTQFNIDHVPLTSTSGTPPNGYHTDIHLVPQTRPVASVAGYGQLYVADTNDGINSGQQLFYQSIIGASTIEVPITMNFNPTVTNVAGLIKGTTFLPGGLILQFGSQTANIGNTVVFTMGFPNNLLSVTATPIGKINTSTPFGIVSSGLGGFSFQNNSGISNIPFYWMAMGN